MIKLNEYLITEAAKVTNISKNDMYVLIAYGDYLIDNNDNDINALIGVYSFKELVEKQIEDGLLISDYLEDYDKDLEKIKSLKIGEDMQLDCDDFEVKIIKVS